MLSFKETSQKCVCRTRLWALGICFLLHSSSALVSGRAIASENNQATAPQATAPQAPQAPQTQPSQGPQTIERIDIIGNRRIPQETIKSRVYTREGDVYDEAALQRDLRSVWNTGYFDDVRIEREQGPKGWLVHIYVKEKPTIRTIEYHGLNSVSVSDVLERYKKLKTGPT
ncbi:MAG TPA: POTRA domain-containing protein, partial [Candidatus Angelobacter sp.]|nr:POTRA domain-containing protein [Candidatus Angelobacter sp.]